MSEPDDVLARLFAEQKELDADGDTFTAAVRRRVAAQRRWTMAGRVSLHVGLAAAAATTLAVVPNSLLNPLLLLERVTSPEILFAAGIVTAAGLAWHSRYADAG